MKTLLVGTLVLGLSPLVWGCTTLQAKKAPVERPALEVPPPPPRIVEPAPAPEPPPEPVPDLPPPSAAPPKPRPQPRPPTTEPKPEPPKPEPPPPDTTAAPPATPPQVPQLRTPQTADGAEAEKNVRATIDRAKSTLGSVNYNGLSNERKKVYNDAKSFIQQAEDASRQGNFVLAQASATKAEVLAKEISGR